MTITILTGCALARLNSLPADSVHTCVTSPPYWGLRDYGIDGQLGLEPTPELFVAQMVEVFRGVRRVLRDDGTLWLNIGDSYNGTGRGGGTARIPGTMSFRDKNQGGKDVEGLKPKDLVGMPWRLAFALQADGWYLRIAIIWHKPNPMPESVSDRPTKSHEYVFLLSKSERYFYDAVAIREPATHLTTKMPDGWDTGPGSHGSFHRNGRQKGERKEKTRGHHRRHDGFADRWDGMRKAEQAEMGRNKRTVWTVATKPFSEAHFATYPPELIEPCILAGCPKGGTVLDPFFGAGTTGLVADRLGRDCIGTELNPEYVEIAKRRLAKDAGMFARIITA